MGALQDWWNKTRAQVDEMNTPDPNMPRPIAGNIIRGLGYEQQVREGLNKIPVVGGMIANTILEPFSPTSMLTTTKMKPASRAFSTNPDTPFINDILQNPKYAKQVKGKEAELQWMSPREYLALEAQEKGTTIADEVQTQDLRKTSEYSRAMRKLENGKEGKKFPALWLEEGTGMQEGRHRALAAQDAGIKEVPVYIVRSTGVPEAHTIPKTDYYRPSEHKWFVEQALKEGKNVPPEVLRDYPELSRKPSIAPEVLKANKTSRSWPGANPQARIIAETVKPGETVLDFGAGKFANQSKFLREQGIDVTTHDFGQNIVEGVHDPKALSRSYDTVMASNVINVQSTPEMLNSTLFEISATMKPGGRGVINYPQTPRYLGLTVNKMRDELLQHFDTVKKIGGTSSAPIWEVGKSK